MKPTSLLPSLSLAALCGCAAPQLPSNVTTTSDGDAVYVDRIDLSFARSAPADFGKLKLCIAQSVQNGDAVLHDAAHSFVGRHGSFYRAGQDQTVHGGDVFKYVDDAAATAIVDGMTVAPSDGVALSGNYVRYELKATTNGSTVGLLFYNLTQAQQNTGASANDGFARVGVWAGARAESIYAAIDQVRSGIRGCMQ